MHEVKIKAKFEVGTEVKEKNTGREGIIQAVYTKLIKVDALTFLVDVSYSVKPEKNYNQFRAKEENLNEIVYDVEGNSLALPN